MQLDKENATAARLYYEKLAPSKLKDHLQRLSLPARGIEYVLRTSNEPPSRLVKSGKKGNDIYRYPSKLMAYTLQCESGFEYRWLIGAHFHENETLWVWDQPPRLYVTGTDVNGHTIHTGYTGDFLRVEPNCVRMIEVKGDDDLQKLACERPQDWVYAEDNRWHYLPAERECEPLGIVHEVIEGSRLPLVLAENHELLIDARESPETKNFTRLRAKVLKLLINNPVIRLSELASRVETVDLTPLLKFIYDGQLISDLNRFRLSLPESSWVSSSASTIQTWIETADRIRLINNEGVSVKDAPRPIEVLRIAARQKLLETEDTSIQSKRTLYRIRAIEREHGGDPRKLATDYANCGRWGEGPYLSRVGKYQESLIAAILRKYYFTADAISQRSAYVMYKAAFNNRKKRGRPFFNGKPVSPNTFYGRIDRYDSAKAGYARGGRREENANFHPTPPEYRELESTRPFQRAHFDHYKLDRYAVLVRTKEVTYVLLPWASVLRDSFSKKPLAFTIRFQSPSRSAVGRVFRDCVRRHGRLPKYIKFDGGSEFKSTFVEGLLAEKSITKCTHGPEMARGSAELERLFGVYRQQWGSARQGNTNNSRRGRATSSAFRGHHQARDTLVELYNDTEEFLMEWYPAHAHGKDLNSPSHLFETGLQRFSCAGNLTAYDKAFEISTSIDVERDFIVDGARGINVAGKWYSDPELYGLNKAEISEVREDCETDRVVYAVVRDKWITCLNGSLASANAVDRAVDFCDSLKRREGREALNAAKDASDNDLGNRLMEAHKRSSQKKSQRPRSNMDDWGAPEQSVSSVPKDGKATARKKVTPHQLNYED